MPTFAELGLSENLLEALTQLGYDRPTPIQEQAIPELLAGRDVIGQAQTGTGKTAAFGLPLLEYVDPEDRDVQALVLTPTRELCIQVTQALRAYGKARGVDVTAVFGGAPIRTQVSQLKAGAQVVVGTVGRVMDLMSRHQLVLDSTRFVVLDEADEMLDLGFLEDVEKILSRAPSGRQTALFSATMPPEIKKLAEKGMYEPVTIKVQAATLTIDTVEHYKVEVAADREKPDALARVMKSEQPRQAIVFARTKIGVDRLARSLGDRGVRVKALHGDMSQGSRDGVMIAFKDGRERLLVATDIAARGLDISGVTHVVNYDIPGSPEVYVHRIGRTGRVGRSGRAITLVTPKQAGDMEAIERHANITVVDWSEQGKLSQKNGAAADRGDAAVEEASAPRSRRRRGSRASEEPGEASAPGAEDDAAGHAVPAVEADSAVEPLVEAAAGADSAVEPFDDPASEPGSAAEPFDDPAAEPDSAAEPVEQPVAEADSAAAPERQPRRPRHTKPRKAAAGPTAKLVVGAGRVHGLEPADVIGAIVNNSHLEGEDVRNVRVLERFTLVEVPADRASEVVETVSDNDVRGVKLRLEVARA
jgi:ATP-dependent RNA helicase DeaD